MSGQIGASDLTRLGKWTLLACAIASLTSCATMSRHQFAEPTGDWQARGGQLLYRGPKTTLIGDVFVRFSKNGELTNCWSGVNESLHHSIFKKNPVKPLHF